MRWTVQGSGWGWLGYSKQLDKVVMTTSPNQDPVHLQVLPQMPPKLCSTFVLLRWAEVPTMMQAYSLHEALQDADDAVSRTGPGTTAGH